MNDRSRSQDISATIRQWWRALQPQEKQRGRQLAPSDFFGSILGRADRARLRRARTSTELLMDPATIILDDRLLPVYAARIRVASKDDPSLHIGIALIAGVLSHVTIDTDTDKSQPAESLASRLGKKVGERRLMSELRFRNLQAARAPDELLRQCIRAVTLAEKKTDVGALGTDLLLWVHELERPPRRPALSVRYRWARDYYLATDKKLDVDETSLEAAQDA